MRWTMRALAAICCFATASAVADETAHLIPNRSLQEAADGGTAPRGFQLSGDAVYGDLGDPVRDRVGKGIRFPSASAAPAAARKGEVAATVDGLKADAGRWFRLRIRVLAQDGFRVEKDSLFLKVEFFRDQGAASLDHIQRHIYGLIEQDRKIIADPGSNPKLGAASWRSYDLEFRTPFPEVDTIRASVAYENGRGTGAASEFWIAEFDLVRIPVPDDYQAPKGGRIALDRSEAKRLVPLGGRWHYDPRGGDRTPPKTFDHANADRLLYLAERFEAPFADNTTAWLRKGYLDPFGQIVDKDRFVPDNVVISLGDKHLLIRSKGLPNHPTALFPDRLRSLDGNPNSIQQIERTYWIPLEPKENPRRIAMKDRSNLNQALPKGPIGIAVNGVVFFNPFDHTQDEDAIWRLDHCCGHPAPNNLYHYHKYPVCVKSPWSDDGVGHSPLIGFAFDGYPIYGPYEAAGTLAKDARTNPLNEFNVHSDELRGVHYHVTPGLFPHVIGGYWGEPDPKNAGKKGPPPKKKF